MTVGVYVSEFLCISRDGRGNTPQVGLLTDYIRTQRLVVSTFDPLVPGSGPVSTVPFLETTNIVRINNTGTVFMACGYPPVVATTNDMRLSPNSTEYMGILPGMELSFCAPNPAVPFIAKVTGPGVVQPEPEPNPVVAKPQISWGKRVLNFFNSN